MSVRSNSIVTPGSRGARSPILLPFLNAFAMLLLFRVFFLNSFTMMCMALYTYSCIATRIRNLVAGL